MVVQSSNSNEYALIEAYVCSQMIENCFVIENTHFDKARYIIMSTRINKDHWCIALADKYEKTFCWINPFGNSSSEIQIYFRGF